MSHDLDFEEVAVAAQAALLSVKSLDLKHGEIGEVECPICRARMRCTVVGARRHVRAQCSTNLCLEILE